MAMVELESTFSCLFTPTVIFCVLNLVIGIVFITSRIKLHKTQDQHQQISGQEAVNPPRLVRASSLLDRVKSFNFSSYRSEEPDPLHSVTQHAHVDPPQEQVQSEKVDGVARVHNDQVARSKSETSTRVEAPAARMSKSASEKAVVVGEHEEPEEAVDRRRPATLRERKAAPLGEDEAVDKKADDFINRFRQQLKLQRLDSLLRYKERLNRGVGS